MGRLNQSFWAKQLGLKLKGARRTSWAIAKEVGASILTYELYPLGVPSGGIPVVTMPQFLETPGRPRVPILFIHGLLHNASAFAWLKQKLALQGWKYFSDMNLNTLGQPISGLASQTAQVVDKLLEQYGVPQIDIIAHSKGGIIARHFLQKQGGDGKVRNLITLGTPHQGTELSRYSLIQGIRELAPESETLQELRDCPLPQITRVVAVAGGLDILMWPRNCVRWEGVRNISLPGVGHAGLLFSRRVLDIIVAHLHPQTAW